jgi:phosphoribosylcarboxyaminoimidazole (NCAIR) mutase
MEILALEDISVREKLIGFRKDQKEKVLQKSERLKRKIEGE